MSQTESGVRRRKSYDDLCDLQFVPYEASRLFFKALKDSAITVFCDNLLTWSCSVTSNRQLGHQEVSTVVSSLHHPGCCCIQESRGDPEYC